MKNMTILGLNIGAIIEELCVHQNRPWNRGMANDSSDFVMLNLLFDRINNTDFCDDFIYQGPLYRIHCGYCGIEVDDNSFSVGRIAENNSRWILPKTIYDDNVVSFSKCCDFTKRVYYHVLDDVPAVIIRVNTKSLKGIDINKFYDKYGSDFDLSYNDRFRDEQEVLFPLLEDHVIKEYVCTPKQFNYYMRNVVN